MADYYVKPAGGTPGTGTFLGVRANSTAYALGDVVTESGASDHYVYECTTAGTSGAAVPTYVKTPGSTFTDGTVTWTCRLPTSWALATSSLQKADGACVAGDTALMADTVNETYGATTVFSFAGTPGNPCRIISAALNSSPPTYSAGARINSGASQNLDFRGSIYVRGLSVYAGGGGASNSDVILAGGSVSGGLAQVWEDCYLDNGNGSTGDFTVGETGAAFAQVVKLIRCTIRIRNAAANWIFNCPVELYECNTDPAGALATLLCWLNPARRTPKLYAFGCDFSRLATGAELISVGDCTGEAVFDKCKFPSGFTGNVLGVIRPGVRVSLYECEFGTTRQILWIKDNAGSIKEDTAIYRSGGASDGIDPLSWKLETGSIANPSTNTLYTDWIAVPVYSTGSKTFTVELVHDDTAGNELEDDEAWLEIGYMGTASSRDATFDWDRLTDFLATPADQDTSSVTWNGTSGFGNVIKQKLVKTVTVNEEGIVYVRAALARPSKIVYLCPKVDVT